ncbi:hypothetical protein ACQY0O_007310 [Thecaphora frezii]
MRSPLVSGQSSQDGLRYLVWAAAHLSRALLAAETSSHSNLGSSLSSSLGSSTGSHGRSSPHASWDSNNHGDPLLEVSCPPHTPSSHLNLRDIQSRIWSEPSRLCHKQPTGSKRHYSPLPTLPSSWCRSGQRRTLSTGVPADEAEAPADPSDSDRAQVVATGADCAAPGSDLSLEPFSEPSSDPNPEAGSESALEPDRKPQRATEPAIKKPKRHEHWTSPLLVKGSTASNVDADTAFVDLRTALKDLKLLSAGDNEAGFRDKLSDALDRIWQCYRAVCHMKKMPIPLRIKTARVLVDTMRRIKSQKQSSATIIKESALQGKRVGALVRDCEFFLQLGPSRGHVHTEAGLQAWRRAIANLEIQSKALLGEEIAARKMLATLLEGYKDALSATLEGRTFLEAHLPSTEASDLVQSMCAVMDAMIARDLTARRSAGKDLRGPVDYLAPVLRLPPSDANGADKQRSTPSRQESFLNWLLKHPHAFALVSSQATKFGGRRFSQFMSMVEDPIELLSKAVGKDDWAAASPSMASTQLMLAFVRSAVPSAGVDIYRHATGRGAIVPEDAARKLLLAVVWSEDFVLIESLIRLITRNVQRDAKRGARQDRHLGASTLATIALFRARQAQVEKMELVLAEMERREVDAQYLGKIARLARMESIIARGDVQGYREEMGKKFALGTNAKRADASDKPPPNKEYYASLLRCCNVADDVQSAVECWDEMIEAGVAPDTLMFNSLLELFARGSDADSALQLLENMREWDVKPNTHTYTTMVHLFALRKDTEGAINAVKAMLAEGLEPTRVTWTALLNAYVESASWDAAIGLFRWMQKNPKISLRPTVATCNTLLKAYVRRAAPLQTVLSTVADMRTMGVEWNDYTYALMLQSATDAGFMDIAEEIFSNAERQLPPPPGLREGQGANLYHFTIMINGYLRQGNTEEAKDYFNELRDRGIEPSATTWSAIISSYASGDSEDNFHLARTLVTQLVKDEVVRGLQRPRWRSPALKQGPPYENMFLPLILAHGRRGESEEAERTADDLMQTGSGLSLYTLTVLLDSYRQAGEVDKAVQLFDTLYEQVISDTNIDLTRMFGPQDEPHKRLGMRRDRSSTAGYSLETAHNIDPARRSMLCLPISIMINLLSSAGLHTEIARLWSRAKTDGFAFDPHNWNHLAAAMARAGKMEEALTIVERVLNRPVPDFSGRRRKQGRWLPRPDEVGEDGSARPRVLDGCWGDSNALKERARFSQEDDPLSMQGLYPSHLVEGADMTISPANPPNRRHQHRHRDDPHTPLPFTTEEEDALEEDESDAGDGGDPKAPAAEDLSEAAQARQRQRREAAERDVTEQLYEHRQFELLMNPWYAHFETVQAISEGLHRLAESDRSSGKAKVGRLLAKYRTAARIVSQHRRKVDAIEEQKRAEAERSARELIDQRGHGTRQFRRGR